MKKLMPELGLKQAARKTKIQRENNLRAALEKIKLQASVQDPFPAESVERLVIIKGIASRALEENTQLPDRGRE